MATQVPLSPGSASINTAGVQGQIAVDQAALCVQGSVLVNGTMTWVEGCWATNAPMGPRYEGPGFILVVYSDGSCTTMAGGTVSTGTASQP